MPHHTLFIPHFSLNAHGQVIVDIHCLISATILRLLMMKTIYETGRWYCVLLVIRSKWNDLVVFIDVEERSLCSIFPTVVKGGNDYLEDVHQRSAEA